jgi:hypothetical protein
MLRVRRLVLGPVLTAVAVLFAAVTPITQGVEPLASMTPVRSPEAIAAELVAAPSLPSLVGEVHALALDPVYVRVMDKVREHLRAHSQDVDFVGPEGETTTATTPEDAASTAAATLRATLTEIPPMGEPDADAVIAQLNTLAAKVEYRHLIELLAEFVETPTVAMALAEHVRSQSQVADSGSETASLAPIHHTPNDWIAYALWNWNLAVSGIEWSLTTEVLPCLNNLTVVAGCLYGTGPYAPQGGPLWEFAIALTYLAGPAGGALIAVDGLRQALVIDYLECRSWICSVDARASSESRYDVPSPVEVTWTLTPAVGPSIQSTATGYLEEAERGRQDLQFVWRAWDVLQPWELSDMGVPFAEVCSRFVTVTATVRVYWPFYTPDWRPGLDHTSFDEATMTAPVCAVPEI